MEWLSSAPCPPQVGDVCGVGSGRGQGYRTQLGLVWRAEVW